MFYLILTIILWQPDSARACAGPTIQMIEFRDQGACLKAAATWKTSVLAARPKREADASRAAYSLSAECVASDSTSRIK